MTYGPGPQGWGGQPYSGGVPVQGNGENWVAPGTPWQSEQGWPGQFGQAPSEQPPAYGGWPSAPPVAVAHYGPGPGKRNRKALIITLSVVAVVVVILIVIGVVVSLSGGSSGSAGDAVKAYLDALSRGDATAALSYSTDQPGSKDLLTDDILKKQIAQWPISDIRILDDNSAHSYGFGQVHVSAKFGDNTSDVTLSVKKHGDGWKLEHAAIKLDTLNSSLNNEAVKTVTLFGKSVGTSPAYVFPGYMDTGSTNSNIKVTTKKPLLLDALSSYSGYYTDFDFQLSSTGLSGTSSAISAALADCARSTQLSPPNCPQHTYDYDMVDGTAVWGTPDTSGIKINLFDQYRLDAMFSGEVTFTLTAKTRSGGTKTATVNAFVSGHADLSQNPVTVSLR